MADTFHSAFAQWVDLWIAVSSPEAMAQKKYVPSELIVKFRTEKINLKQPSAGLKLQIFEDNNNLESDTFLLRENIAVVQIQGNESVESKIEQLKSDPNVEYAQPNFIYTIAITDPNDTDFGKLRWLKNSWQNVNGSIGSSGADIQWNEAMDIFSWNGNPATTWTIVAVIDNGVNYNHIDLINTMWSWITCVSYTGMTMWWCLYGYDFYSTGDNNPFPNGADLHGSHVAWTIGAGMNNATGVVGVNPHVKIMAVRAWSGNELTTEDISQWIDFAKYNGAKIINASRWWWSTGCSDVWDQLLYDSIKNFPWLFIASAGNETQNHLNGYFSAPSDYAVTTSCRTGLDNIVWVAATDQNDLLASFSDYWSWSIHVWAPGVNIYSTVLSNGYGYLNGTSMAAPHVAGLASLAWSYRPDLSYLDIKNAIIHGGDALASLSGKTVSWKRINAYMTLYTLTATVTGSITFLSWTRTNSTWTYVRLASSKTGSYEMSGVGMIGILTWTISLSWVDRLIQLSSWDGVKSIGVVFSDTVPKQSQLYTASIVLDTTAPSIPSLVSPITWANVSWTIHLLWNASLDTWGMSGYSYEVSSDSGMNTLVATWTTTFTWVSLSLFSWASYYRRVKAIDLLNQYSSFSQTGDFVLLRDSWPDAFSFTSVTSAELSTQYTSNQIIIGWMNTGSVISIVGGIYQVNGTGEFISTNWIVHSWDMLYIRATSSSAYSTSVTATVDIGWTAWNFSVTTKSAPSGGWGGWGGWWAPTPSCLVSNLVCSGWVYVMKTWVNCIGGNLGNTCTSSSATWSTGTIAVPISLHTTSSTWSIANSPFSVEMNDAYLYAYEIGITTLASIQKADMTWSLIRAHMAKMMANYAIKVLDKTPDTWAVCTFTDIADQTSEMKLYIKLACQLGLMGISSSIFDPKGAVTRAQFGTVLSRTLYGDIYNNWVPFYSKHLNALKLNGIITNTNPEIRELRGYVMIMLMRAAE